jgi:hypothetical protein
MLLGSAIVLLCLREVFVLLMWRKERLSFAFVSWSVTSSGLRLQGEGNWPF